MLNRGIKRLLCGLVSLGCVISISACATATAGRAEVAAPVVERVIVQFKVTPTEPGLALTELAQKYQLGMLFERELGRGFYIGQLTPPLTASQLQPYLDQIGQDPNISSIDADAMMHTMPVQ